MEINKIFNSNLTDSEQISKLKNKTVRIQKTWSELLKEYDSTKHSVNDKMKRKDKRSKNKVEEVARIHLDLEKLIVKRMVEFMFALPVKRVYSGLEDDKDREDIIKAIEAVYKDNRIDTANISRAKELFATCEMCTYWFKTEKEHNRYGFETKTKLKSKTFSPMGGYRLYPLFDEFDNMVAMSIEYDVVNSENKLETHFETYTDTKHVKWIGDEKVLDTDNPLKKIPFIYSYRNTPIWDGIQPIVQEIETILSNNSDIIAYNASPILVVTGDISGSEDKGNTKRVYRLQNGGNVSYATWQQSIEAIKYQIDMLLRLMWALMQLPDMSFDNIKGLGSVSGKAMKVILSDAHLKVGDEQGPFIEFFDRESNIIKAYLSSLNPKWASKIEQLDVEHVITPFVQEDLLEQITIWQKSNGGKALMSQEESIERLGLSSDPKVTIEKIREEETQAAANNVMSLFERAE